MSQTEILSRASLAALVVVSVAFFIFVLFKAPMVGFVKISITMLGWFKLALVTLLGLFWVFLNYRAASEN